MTDTAVDDFVETLTYAYHRLTSLSQHVHGASGLTTGERAILLLLAKGPSLTLSEIAEARGVSRQFIQKIAQPLLHTGLLQLEANARHRTSPKLALSDAGRMSVETIRVRERDLATRISRRVPADDLLTAQRCLDEICLAIDEELAVGLEDERP